MKIRVWIAVVAVMLVSAGILLTQDDREDVLRPTPKRIGHTEYACDLFQRTAAAEAGENFCISPYSIELALAMTWNGAQAETDAGMRKALSLSAGQKNRINSSFHDVMKELAGADKRVRLDIANSLWAKEGLTFKPQFLETNEDYYDATTRSLNFASPEAAKTINGWVKEKTNQKIDSIVPDSIPGDTILYLINAIYFNGTWTDKFDPDRTRDMEFTLADGTTVKTPTMYNDGAYEISTSDGVSVVRLPYGDTGRLGMIIAMPDDPAGIAALQESLTPDTWKTWTAGLRRSGMDLYLPKFKLEYKTKLNDTLIAMGMDKAFSESEADFKDMIDLKGQNVFIGSVAHKTFIEVNETGTEAAAVTAVEMKITSMPPQLRINKPFVFAIHDRQTETILFMGTVMDPR